MAPQRPQTPQDARDMPRPYLSTKQLAVRLGVHVDTAKGWRVTGEGPPFMKLPTGMVRYDPDAVEAWLAKRCRKSTSDAGGRR
jgi:predicted DNA-binding transcriptional regulator AlpA